jgi:hypothetical protein
VARWFRRTGSEVLGWLLVAVGLVLLVLPGPGTLLLLAGVALLAPHYAWARRAMDHLHDAAIEAAHKSVQTKRRIAWSFVSAGFFIAVGVVWLLEPRIPVFTVGSSLHLGPGLPGGRAAGIGLMASGIVAMIVLGYSVIRWYPTAASQEK